MEVNEEILKKANEILDAKAYEKKCLKARICPKCGTPLLVQDVGGEWLIELEHTCPSCSYFKKIIIG